MKTYYPPAVVSAPFVVSYERYASGADIVIDWEALEDESKERDRWALFGAIRESKTPIPLWLKAREQALPGSGFEYALRAEYWELNPDELRAALTDPAYHPHKYRRPFTVRITAVDRQ